MDTSKYDGALMWWDSLPRNKQLDYHDRHCPASLMTVGLICEIWGKEGEPGKWEEPLGTEEGLIIEL